MKKIVFILALAALCGAAFANNVSDPGVTLRGWDYFSSSAPAGFVSLADGKGFAVTATREGLYSGFTAYNVSGWVFDENESINVKITEASGMSSVGNQCVAVIPYFDGDTYEEVHLFYAKPYTGVGEYTFTVSDIQTNDDPDEAAWFVATRTESAGKTPYEFILAVGDYDPDEGYIYFNTFDVGGRFSATFGKTVVPEPTSAAYALLGLGSLLGIKRKIRK